MKALFLFTTLAITFLLSTQSATVTTSPNRYDEADQPYAQFEAELGPVILLPPFLIGWLIIRAPLRALA
jgi:hypothetical protein